MDAEVLIAGGGPVGMGLAIELGQRGISVLVVERYPAPQRVPKGQNLTQRTMEHMQAWGCEPALRAARTIPKEYGIGGLTAYATLLGDYRYDWLQRELVRPFYRADNERLPQYATEEVLRARAAALPSVEILCGWDAGAVVQDADGVTLTIRERGGAAERQVRGPYLVGCDGSRSGIREQAGIAQTLADHEKLMVLLVFHSKELGRLLARFPGKSFYNVLQPDQKGYWLFFGRVDLDDNWFFHAPVPRSARDEGGFDFEGFLHDAVGAPFDVDFEHVGFWDLRFAIADGYRQGRVFLAGDAAHSHPPYGGYGINTGFEDARNLGWKLAATLRGWGGEALLDSYHDERHGVFASTARDFIEKAIDSDRRFLEAFDPARDRAAFEAEWAARGSGARDEVRAYAPNYGGSPVVWGNPGPAGTALGHHAFAARAGHHLSPPGEGELGEGFTLLAPGLAADAATEFRAAAEALAIPLTVLAEPDPELAAFYKAGAILVRPDQFVAWAGDQVAPGEAPLILARAAGLGPAEV